MLLNGTIMQKFVVIIAIFIVTIAKLSKSWRLARANSGRIVGGNDTTIENIPYQISLQIYNSHYCGGSIISREWIVTAGHCVGNDPRWYSIRAGSTKHDNGGSVHKVKQIIRHDGYGSVIGLPKDDIALIQVDTPFKFDKSRQPIPLFNQDEESIPGVMAVITGWGNTFHGFPNVLQRVLVPIVSKKNCDENYIQLGGLPKNQICAAYPEGGKDACQGDSGGPLAIDGRLAGITSWGMGCAESGYPGVYTEVGAYRRWIKRNINV